MTRSCCVPFCSSVQGKHKNLAFHEFPSNLELRNAWINVILRRGDEPGTSWQPRGCSIVCSKHFTENDYSVSTKRKILLPNAVPSIFPNYPAYAKAMQSSIKDMPPIPASEKLSVKRKCVKKQHFETFVFVESVTDINEPERNGNTHCHTQNESNLKSAKTKTVTPVTICLKKRTTPDPAIEKQFVKKICVKKHFGTALKGSKTDANQLKQNGDIHCPTQNESTLKSAETNTVTPYIISSEKRETPAPTNVKPFVTKICVKEQHFETDLIGSKADFNQLEDDGDTFRNTRNESNLKSETGTPFTFSSEERIIPAPTDEKPVVEEICVKEELFEIAHIGSEADENQLEQNGDIQCRVQNPDNSESSNTNEIVSELQEQIKALKEENSNLCNIIITLNHKINELQSQKKYVTKKAKMKK